MADVWVHGPKVELGPYRDRLTEINDFVDGFEADGNKILDGAGEQKVAGLITFICHCHDTLRLARMTDDVEYRNEVDEILSDLDKANDRCRKVQALNNERKAA
ncbi:hypothetical protein Hte_006333 [Hypoxylon texense]